VSFFRQLTEKSWLPGRSKGELPEGSVYYLPAQTIAVRLIMMVATVVFSLRAGPRESCPRAVPITCPRRRSPSG
jgi:hypothetical protein